VSAVVGAATRSTGDEDSAEQLSFLNYSDLSDAEVEHAMIEAMDRVLDHPPRVALPAGSIIVAEGEELGGITVVLEGRVRLYRDVVGQEVVFHHLTAGRIIGLMSLVRGRPAVFNVEAETAVTVMPVSFEQLDRALISNPGFAALFVSVLVRSMARRNLRSVEQQLQIREFARSRIQESERLAVVGQLAAGVAHELNNPLQGIVAYAHLLLEGTAEDDRRRGSIEKIVDQADRCIRIIRALLDFSRPSKPQKRSSDVNSMIEDCVGLVEEQVLFLNIEIERRLDPDLPRVMVDPSQIQQVLMNLVINAAEAMDGSGRLSLRSRRTYGDVEVEIADTGPGIAAEDVERVFDPFFSTKEASHGTGLGLAISYGIISEHDGSISVESPPGGGATFVVRLPIRAERTLSRENPQE